MSGSVVDVAGMPSRESADECSTGRPRGHAALSVELPVGRLPDEVRGVLRAADAFGDALVILDARGERVLDCSDAASRRWPAIVAGASALSLESVIPGTAAVIEACDGASEAGTGSVRTNERGAARRGTRIGGAVIVRFDDRAATDEANVAGGPGTSGENETPAGRSGVGREHGSPETRRDVHDYLRARDDLFSRSRTISVSEMATTLAHEINQPVGTVVNVLRGARRRVERGGAEPAATLSALAPVLDTALEQALYTSSVVARIRDFTRSRRPAREPIDVASLLARSLALLDWLLEAEACRLETALPEALPTVVGDATMLQQVLVNLIRNAVEAMLETPRDARVLRVSAGVDSGRLVMLVEDRGQGFGRDERDLFVPFATAKPDGMGVGLNICRSFVELHGGRLWLAPNEWGGCTARVELPPATEIDS